MARGKSVESVEGVLEGVFHRFTGASPGLINPRVLNFVIKLKELQGPSWEHAWFIHLKYARRIVLLQT